MATHFVGLQSDFACKFSLQIVTTNPPSFNSHTRPLVTHPKHICAVAVRADPGQPFNEGAAQVKRLVNRDRKEFLGNDVDILDQYTTEFGDMGPRKDGQRPNPGAPATKPKPPSSSPAAASTAPAAAAAETPSTSQPAASPAPSQPSTSKRELRPTLQNSYVCVLLCMRKSTNMLCCA